MTFSNALKSIVNKYWIDNDQRLPPTFKKDDICEVLERRYKSTLAELETIHRDGIQ